MFSAPPRNHFSAAGAAAAVALASGIPLTLTEAMATGSVSALTQYQTQLTCINGTTGSTTVLPSGFAGASYSFGSLQFGDAIQCTFTNTAFPHLTLAKALGTGGRLFNTDQFTVSITTGATTVATATTTGTGSTVSTGSTAQTQVVAGTNYTLNEVAAGTTTIAQYTSGLACTNAFTGSTTVLPTTLGGVVRPALGDVISCVITNTRRTANATLTIDKTSTLVSDGVTGTVNPHTLPGATVRYAIQVANTGSLTVDSSSIFILDPLPATVAYDSAQPVTFTNGAISSGLSYNAATDVRFATGSTPPANFAACTYTPGAGVDPNVRFVCLRPSGVMAAATGAGQPSFTISFGTRVQ